MVSFVLITAFFTAVFMLLYRDERSFGEEKKRSIEETSESSYLLYMQFANISKLKITFSSHAAYLLVLRFGHIDDDVKQREY